MGWLSRVGAHFIKRQNRLLWSAGPCRHSSRSVVEETQQKYSAGQKLHGYTVQKVVPVPELYLTGVLLHHDRTDAEHLHVARDDANNVFGVAFRTTPMDSTGVPHILEHTALCGSEKFPVRDPFFKMLNRSLSTFMNAFTSNDWTFYPFSTQNPQDYENLLSVYLDAAFFPRLREHDFRQEGWRLENENLSDPDSSIVFKGIVFNEMKGVFSNSQNIFAQKVQNTLMPSHTYSVVSGGDPMAIPDLTWQQLRDFHSSHYHPSNARFYTYGNLPLEHHLQFIDGNALSKFDKIDPKTEVPLETRWTAGRDHDIICSPDPMAPDPAKQTTVAISYLLTDITDTKESTVLSILGSLLVDGDTSPFYQSLLEANIGSDYSPVIGYDANTREASFSVGLQGIHQDDIAKVKDIIHSTIDKVTEEGFEQERVDALLHRIELSLKHESEKFGLNLGVSILGPWNHGADPTELMQVSHHVNYFKQCLHDDPNFLKNKVRTHFKDNQHKVTLVMRPDENFEKERQEEETRKLHSLVHSLSDSNKQEIYLQGQKLADLQNAEEDLSCLPSLKINDIAPTLIPVHTDIIHAGKVEMQISEQPTNGVTYFCAVSNTRDLPAYLKAYVPLFCSVVTKMGAGEYGYKELSQQMELHTGGMNATCHIASHHTDHNAMEEGILFSSYSLDRNVPKMFELWTEIFHRLDLSDGNRLTTLVLMSAADLASSLADSGHRFAMTHAASSLTATAQHKEGMNGVSQVSLMKALAEMKDLSPIIHNLKEIASHVLSQQNLRCAINAAPEFMNSVVKITETFVKQLKDHGKGDLERYTKDFGFTAKTLQTQFELPFQVNYMSRSCRSVPFTHPDFADLRILARLMTNKYLHREIREKGGAYGGGATGQIPGVFNFYSYRDPNSMSTLEAFDAAVEWVKRGEFTQQDVDEAKLSTFSQVDMPLTPGHRGERLFLTGITDSMLQDHRMQLFAVNKDSLITASDRYLSKENRVSSVSFLGPENPAVKNESWSIKKH